MGKSSSAEAIKAMKSGKDKPKEMQKASEKKSKAMKEEDQLRAHFTSSIERGEADYVETLVQAKLLIKHGPDEVEWTSLGETLCRQVKLGCWGKGLFVGHLVLSVK